MRGLLLLLLTLIAAPSVQGQIIWTNDVQGHFTIAVTVNESGDVYTVGSREQDNGEQRILVTKVTSAGATAWEHVLGASHAFGSDIAVDSQGNAYAIGYVKTTGHNLQNDWLLAKIAADGTLEWTRTYDGTNAHEDIPHRVLVDDADHVYVGGRTIQTVDGTSDWHVSVIKYDGDGNVLWERHHNGAEKQFDNFGTMAWDGEGNLLVYAISWQKQVWPNTFDAPRLLKYDRDGNLLLDVLLPSEEATHRFYDAESDAEGNLLVYEALENRAGFPRYIRKVSPSGEVVFNTPIRPDSTNWNHNQNQGVITVDSNGRPWWANTIQTNPRNTFPFLFDRMVEILDGDAFMVATREQVIASKVAPRDMVADSDGYVYVATQVNVSRTDSLLVEKFDSEGAMVWSMMVDKHYGSMSQVWLTNSFNVSLEPLGDGKLVVSYSSQSDNTSTTVAQRKRIRTVLLDTGASSGVAIEEEAERPVRFALHGNYPNPFNPSTTIEFSLDRGAEVRLSVVDLLGRERALLTNTFLSEGVHQVTFDAGSLPSGQYFYRLEAEGRSFTRIMTLHK